MMIKIGQYSPSKKKEMIQPNLNSTQLRVSLAFLTNEPTTNILKRKETCVCYYKNSTP